MKEKKGKKWIQVIRLLFSSNEQCNALLLEMGIAWELQHSELVTCVTLLVATSPHTLGLLVING